MGKQSYWSLLIFCAVLSQGFAILSGDNVEQSSSLHIRKKRVIDLTRNGGPVHLSRAPYIVNILKNGESHCAGTILDADIIITTPYCIDERPGATYRILSNSRLRNNGTPHHVTSRSSSLFHGFVVFKITPPIELQHGLNAKIDLFLGEIPPYASGIFSGWGCNSLEHWSRVSFPEELMQTKLPILTRQECSVFYGGHLPDQQLCTLDRSQRRAPCLGDEGGPLVYGNRLLGILLFRGFPVFEHPDIFFNFNEPHIHEVVNIHMNILRGVH